MWKFPQQQASQFLPNVYGRYWSASYLTSRHSVAVDVAVAVDTVSLGPPSEFGSVAPASRRDLPFFLRSPFAGSGFIETTKPASFEATSAATSSFAVL